MVELAVEELGGKGKEKETYEEARTATVMTVAEERNGEHADSVANHATEKLV